MPPGREKTEITGKLEGPEDRRTGRRDFFPRRRDKKTPGGYSEHRGTGDGKEKLLFVQNFFCFYRGLVL